jgi:hypothetical protein
VVSFKSVHIFPKLLCADIETLGGLDLHVLQALICF